MTLFALIIPILIIAFLFWVILQLPVPQPFKNIILGIGIFFCVIFILQQFGIATGLPHLRLW